jgi:hypothetical protein
LSPHIPNLSVNIKRGEFIKFDSEHFKRNILNTVSIYWKVLYKKIKRHGHFIPANQLIEKGIKNE